MLFLISKTILLFSTKLSFLNYRRCDLRFLSDNFVKHYYKQNRKFMLEGVVDFVYHL